MAKKPSTKKPDPTDSRFVETGLGVKIIRPGKGVVDTSNPPPPRK